VGVDLEPGRLGELAQAHVRFGQGRDAVVEHWPVPCSSGVEEAERPGQMLCHSGSDMLARLGAIGKPPSCAVDRLQPAQRAVAALAGG
jgi:hypothetical protein